MIRACAKYHVLESSEAQSLLGKNLMKMENYHILGRIGEGAHGIVSKAKKIEVLHNNRTGALFRSTLAMNSMNHTLGFVEWRSGRH